MKDIFLETFNEIISKSIEKFEKEKKIILPIEYIEFIKEFNGGFVKSNEFIYENNYISIEVFYGLQNAYKDFDLENHYKLDMYNTLNRDIILIAQCLGQNYIGLSIGDKNKSFVYYIDIEEYIQDFDISKIKYLKICDNFTDFIDKLL